MQSLEVLLEEVREALFSVRAFCYEQARFFDKKLKELEKFREFHAKQKGAEKGIYK